MGIHRGIESVARRLAAAALVCALGIAVTSNAAVARHRMLTDPDLDAALVIDAKSGHVLYARNADAARHPASLTKMMTLYLLFEELRAHRLALDSVLPVSANAAVQPRSHIRLREGMTIPVETAIKAIVVCSANDAAVTVAEAIGGSEGHFAQLMTAKARAFGMTHTFFHNATGLPDDLQQTTAEDLVILARHMVYDFPEYYGYFRLTEMTWRGDVCTTHNSLIQNYAGADGIKTGYIEASGYNLVGTAERGGRRLIAVVMGGLTAEKRDEEITGLLDATFEIAMTEPAPVETKIVAPRSAPHVTPARAAPASRDTSIAMFSALLVDPSLPIVWSSAAIAAELAAADGAGGR